MKQHQWWRTVSNIKLGLKFVWQRWIRRDSWVKIWWNTSTIISRIIPSSCFCISLLVLPLIAAPRPFLRTRLRQPPPRSRPAPVVRPPPRPRPLPVSAAPPPRPRRLHSPMSSSTTSTVSGAFSSVLRRTVMTRRWRIAFAAVITDKRISPSSPASPQAPSLFPPSPMSSNDGCESEESKSSSSKPKKVERFFVVYQWHSVVLVRSVNLREEHRRLFGSFLLDFSKYCNPGNFSKLINLVNGRFWRFISY